MGLPFNLEMAVDRVVYPGTPHAGGEVELPPPGLQIVGLSEPLALPLSSVQAVQLADAARRSEFGKVMEGEVDGAMACLQVDGDGIRFENPEWELYVKRLKDRAVGELGLEASDVEVRLRKMVVYGKRGGFGWEEGLDEEEQREKDDGKEVVDGAEESGTKADGGDLVDERDLDGDNEDGEITEDKDVEDFMDVEHEDILGRLVVQLPSRFRGGGDRACYKGFEELYDKGGDDGSGLYKSFYATTFGDVQWETIPVLDGFRVTLQYELLWRGIDEEVPRAEMSCMDDLVEELKQMADENEGVWHLVFGLEEWRREDAIITMGVDVLKGADQRKATSLKAAAKMAGMGEVEIIICALGRTDVETYNIDQYDNDHEEQFDPDDCDPDDVEEGSIKLCRAYQEDGSEFKGKLDFVDWERDIDGEVEFERERAESADVDYEVATRDVKMGATAVIMWPKSRGVQVLSICKENMACCLRAAKPSERALIVEQILSALGAHAAKGAALQEAVDLLIGFCIKHDLERHAAMTIDAASKVAALSHTKFVELVHKYGWSAIGDVGERFLCNRNTGNAREVANRIRALYALFESIPDRVIYAALCAIIKLGPLEGGALTEQQQGYQSRDESAIPAQPWAKPPETKRNTDCELLWGMLLATIDRLHAALVEKGYMSALDDLVFFLIKFCNRLDEKSIDPIDSALTARRMRKGVGVLSKLCLAVRIRLFTLRTTRFLNEAAYIVQHKSIPPLYQRQVYRSYLYRNEVIEDWLAFFSFAKSILCTETVVLPECVRRFQSVLQALAYLSQPSWDAVNETVTSTALASFNGNIGPQSFVATITNSFWRAKDLRAEKQLLERIREMEQKTKVEPPNFPVSYDGSIFVHMPEVKAFLEGDKMQLDLTGYRNIAAARANMALLRTTLPTSVECSAGGAGHRAYIRLRKPFEQERMAWLQHQKELENLRQVRNELKGVQARLRQAVRSSDEERQAKRPKSGPKAVHDDIQIVVTNIGQRRISPMSVRDIITIE